MTSRTFRKSFLLRISGLCWGLVVCLGTVVPAYADGLKPITITLAPNSQQDYLGKIQMVVPVDGGALPFTPNVKLSNRDGQIKEHVQQRAVVLKPGLKVCYDLTSFPSIGKEILLYTVEKVEKQKDGSVILRITPGATVVRWDTPGK